VDTSYPTGFAVQPEYSFYTVSIVFKTTVLYVLAYIFSPFKMEWFGITEP